MFSNFVALIGAVALLLWGTYMVKTGILRTFGDSLRESLSKHLKGRFRGVIAGFGLALILQSSTATALLIAGLQGKGLVTTLIALAAVLGADLGSAVVVRVLAFDLSLLIPVLTFLGTMLFLSRPDRNSGQMGRIFLGLAFILSAIAAIRSSSEPLRGEEVGALFAMFSDSIIFCVGIGAALSICCFSSLAAVMIIAGTMTAGTLDISVACWCVLGANLGSAFLALITSWRSSVVVRRAPTGNCIFRSVGFILGAITLAIFPWIPSLLPIGAQGIIYFHLAFNVIVCVLGLLFLKPVSIFVDRLLPNKEYISEFAVRLLGDEDMLTPEMALKELRTETVKSAHLLAEAWKASAQSLSQNLPSESILEMKWHFETIRRRSKTIDIYLDLLVRRGLSIEDLNMWKRLDEANDVLKLVSNIAGKMVENLGKSKCNKDRYFSPEGLEELKLMHQRVAILIEQFEYYLAAAGTLAKDIARKILEAQTKDAAENFNLIAKHMERVAQGRIHSVETNAIHVELLSVFRRIEGILSTTVINMPQDSYTSDASNSLIRR